MRHHAGLSNSFWIYTVKAKLHMYNITPIKCVDYKTPKELWSSQKLNISHLRVFRCLTWVHILKKRRHKLQPKSKAMIFVGYEPGSKGYQFWDAAHQHFEISRDVTFEETQFPVKELKSTQSIPAPLSNCQIPESDTESDSSGLDLVNLAQPPTRPPSPGLPALGSSNMRSQSSRPPSPPIAPPRVPQGSNAPLPDTETAPLQPPTPQYLFCPTKAQEQPQPQASSSYRNTNKVLIHMFQEVPNSYREAMSSPEKDKWLAVLTEEFEGLTEMGIWKLVDCPNNHKTIKCRWTYVLKSDGCYKARLVVKGYTQVQGIDYEKIFSPVARYESI